VTVENLVEWFNAGNPISMTVQLYLDLQTGLPIDKLLPPALAGFAAGHLLFTVVFILWAVLRLRAVALAPAPGLVHGALPLTRWRWRPRVGNYPMFWKELFTAAGFRLRRLGRITWGVLVPASFLPVLGMLYYEFLGSFDTPAHDVALRMNIWVRVTGTLVACLMLVEVALRAANSVRGERDHQTLDSLLCTPLGAARILAAKWFGSIAGLRRAWLWLGLIGMVGIATGGLDWQAVPALILVWLILATFFASLGLWFSVVSATGQRALVATLLSMVAVTAGHWLIWAVALPMAAWLGGPSSAPDWLIELQALGLTPAVTFAWLAYPPLQAGDWATADWDWALTPIRQGLVCWALGAVLVAVSAGRRFVRAIGPKNAREQKGWAPRLKTLFAGAVPIALAGLFLWFLWHSDSSLDRLRIAVAEADRLDPEWRLEELEDRRKAIAPERNSIFVVSAVADERSWQSVPRWYSGKQWPTREMEWALKDLAPEARLNDIQRRVLQAGLVDVQRALAQARRLADFPDGRYPIAYSKNGVNTLLPHVQRNRILASLLRYDAIWRAEEDAADGALASCRASLNAGRAIGDEPVMVSMLVRMACRALALEAIHRVLAQGEPSEEALAELQRLLEREEAEPLFLIAARGERAIWDRFMNALESGAVSHRELVQVAAMADCQVPLVTHALLLTGLTVKNERAALLRFLTRFVEIAKLPAEERVAPLHEWAEEHKELPSLARCLTGGTTWKPSLMRMADVHAHHDALIRCAVVTTAVERYRRAHGRWPDTLQSLLPQFLARVPKDPYDGQPLRYRIVSDGVVLYSIGPDGQDDGGTNLTQTRVVLRGTSSSEGSDVGFRLWNVEQRRQAPRPILDAPPEDK
jgi:ABC-type transport system involved in multi-copper enzyme maturation permease subunit